MPPLLRLGPANQGRPLTWEEYAASRWREGYVYELVDGKLSVTQRHELPENMVDWWVGKKLLLYGDQHPAVVNFVYGKACVFVPGRPGITCLGPDQTAVAEFPYHLPVRSIRWEDVNPVLVVQVLSLSDPDKDLVRNVAFYLQVPTIREYWILDTRQSADFPAMLVYRRRGQRWQDVIALAGGDTYTTRLLPGFSLTLDRHT